MGWGPSSGVFMSGKRNIVNNYRRITISPFIEKVFPVALYRRLSVANEAMGTIDKFNGGFITGISTSNDIFKLYGLIPRQLHLVQSLLVCFIDFSEAFDLVNHNMSFYPRPVLAFGYCRWLRLCVCVSLCLCVCINHGLVHTITHHSFKLESPNLEQRCKRPWLRSLRVLGVIDLDLQGQI